MVIKKCIQLGHKQKDIAKAYRIHKATISDIYLGKTWSDIQCP